MKIETRRPALGVVKITALAVLLGTTGILAGDWLAGDPGAAWAQGIGGDQGQGGPGSQGGQGNQGGGQGQGGPGADSDAQGPQAGAPAGSGGGKPVWAQEGIPEVELGRLNVARSPDAVLDRAFSEAIGSITPEMVDFYNMSLDEMIYELSINFDEISFIDSPLQNLALLRDALDGTTDLAALGVTNDVDTLMAVFLGVASDKNLPITMETALAVSILLGYPLTVAEATAVAAEAEAIRIAILSGHG
ncbi:MAG: hypothetical protein OEM24_02750 [Paracoccaceae bacterium]|nr:hypothetical protein [Paracoccaceae bacterium]